MNSSHWTPGTIRLRVGGVPPVELSFVEEGAEIFLVASDPMASWARESSRSPVQVSRPDGSEEARTATPLGDPQRTAEILSAFRQKYGASAWERYFRGRNRILVLTTLPVSRKRSTEEVLRAEFDAIAGRYTAAIEQNPFGRYLRKRSESRFLPLFSGHDPILELGPGTGIETLELLRAGHHVIAVDISQRMLDQLRRRADAANLSAGLETRCGSIGELEAVLTDLPPRSLGGALSTFGALNLEPHLDRLPSVLARLFAPDAKFFAGILSRRALASVAFLLLAGHPREAVRRLRTPIVAGGFLCPLEVRPFTVREFSSLFQNGFVVEETRAASVIVPPYFSGPLYSFWGFRGRGVLARLDERISGFPPFRELGEYVFVTFRRRAGTRSTRG